MVCNIFIQIKSREILNVAGCDINLTNENFPFMTFKDGLINKIPVRIFRISFTGELSYEHISLDMVFIYGSKFPNVRHYYNLMPYGTEAMHVLRVEKGFIIVGQETDGSVNPLDLGMS